MVDQKLLKKKIILINECLNKITGYLGMAKDAFLSNSLAQDVVEYNLFIIINQVIDMANHIAVDNEYGQVETLGDGFKLLNRNGIISEKELETCLKMVGFRNIIAHQYLDLNKEIVYDIMKNKLQDISKFVKIIDKEFL